MKKQAKQRAARPRAAAKVRPKKAAAKRPAAPKRKRAAQASPSLGRLIDALYRRSLVIQKMEARLKEAKEAYKQSEADLLRSVTDADLNGARGKLALASVSRKEHLHFAENGWPAFEQYVYRFKALDLLQKRPSITAWREREAHGQKVPGVELFIEKALSLRANRS